MKQNKDGECIDYGDEGIFPVDLYTATLWKHLNKATRFIHVANAGDKLSDLKKRPLYTPAIESDMENKGFSVFKDAGIVCVVCSKVCPAAIIAYRNEVTHFLEVVTSNMQKTIQVLNTQLEGCTGEGADTSCS